jgi:hypothetical protein
MFGREAMAAFPYIECFPGGWKRVRGGAGQAGPARGVCRR